MSRALSILVSLVWALWFGGMVMLLASVLRLFDAFEGDRETAGRGASALFRLFESYQLVLAAVALLATFGWRLAGGSVRLKTALFALFALATVGAAASTTLITPNIEALRQRGLTATPEFKRLHGISSGVYMAGAAALLLAGVVLPAAIRSDAAAARRTVDPHQPSGNGNGAANGLAKPAGPPLAAASHPATRD